MTTTQNYVIFKIDNEMLAIPVSVAYEIISYQEPTEIPEIQEYIKGVINIRGSIMPAIDLRLKLGKNEKELDENTSIIMLDFKTNEKKYKLGIIVDEVVSILEIDELKIIPVPSVGSKYNSDFVNGMLKTDSNYIIILDIIKIITQNKITIVTE